MHDMSQIVIQLMMHSDHNYICYAACLKVYEIATNHDNGARGTLYHALDAIADIFNQENRSAEVFC